MKKVALRFLGLFILSSALALSACSDPVPKPNDDEPVVKPSDSKTDPHDGKSDDAQSDNDAQSDADAKSDNDSQSDVGPGPGDPCDNKNCGANASCVAGTCECDSGFATYDDGQECLNSITISCKVPEGYLVPNGYYKDDTMVTLNYSEEHGWDIRPECPIGCNDGFTDNADENCERIGGAPDKLPCSDANLPQFAIAISAEKPTVWDGSSWVADNCAFECDDDHRLSADGTYCRELAAGECSNRAVFISEIFEGCTGNKTGSRFIELYNDCDSDIDLSDYTLKMQTNENTQWTNITTNNSSLKNIIIKAGSTLTIGGGLSTFGLDISADIHSQPGINGDDRIGLFKGDKLIDIYGEEDVSGTDKYWNYAEKKVIRKPGQRAAVPFADEDGFSDVWELSPIACDAEGTASIGHHAMTDCAPGEHAEGIECLANEKEVPCDSSSLVVPEYGDMATDVLVTIHYVNGLWEEPAKCAVGCTGSRVYTHEVCALNEPEVKYCTDVAPENATSTKVELKVIGYENDEWVYEPAKDCVWECLPEYANENNSCINEKQVECKHVDTPSGGVANNGVLVTIHYIDGVWEAAPKCTITCNEGYAELNGKCQTKYLADCNSDFEPEHATIIAQKKYVTVLPGTNQWGPVPYCDIECENDGYMIQEDGLDCVLKQGNDCASDDLFISEVVDSDCSGGPKYLEIYNACAKAISLDGWSIRTQSATATAWTIVGSYTINGTAASNLSSLTIEPGQAMVFAQKNNAAYYYESEIISGSISVAGKGRYALFKGETLVDVYGGSDTYWNFVDKRVIRAPGYKASATFVREADFADEWLVSDAACTQEVFSSLGNHDFIACANNQHVEGENCVDNPAITTCQITTDVVTVDVLDGSSFTALAKIEPADYVVAKACMVDMNNIDVAAADCKNATIAEGIASATFTGLSKGEYLLYFMASNDKGTGWKYCDTDGMFDINALNVAVPMMITVSDMCGDFAKNIEEITDPDIWEVQVASGMVAVDLMAPANSAVKSLQVVREKSGIDWNDVESDLATPSNDMLSVIYSTEFDGTKTLKYLLRFELDRCEAKEIEVYTAAAQGSNEPLVTYAEDFDALGSSGDILFVNDSTLPGWFTNPKNIYLYKDTSSTGGLYNFGETNDSDRSLGAYTSGSYGGAFAVAIKNDSSKTVTKVVVSFMNEHWRKRSGNSVFSCTYDIVDEKPTTIPDASTNKLTDLNITPVNTTVSNGTTLNGNLAANRTERTTTLEGINIPAGNYFILHWNAPKLSNGNGLAIDDLKVEMFE